MTIAHRNTSDSEQRSNSTAARVARNLSAIPVPAPLALQNSFSMLRDDSTDSDSGSNVDNLEWNQLNHTSESEVELSDEPSGNDYDNYVDSGETSDSNRGDNEVDTSSSEDSTVSEDEIIINQKRYRRIRQPWCKDGVPCVVSSVVMLLAFAYFMQFVFYMCGLVSDDCCSPSSLLQCSKGRF